MSERLLKFLLSELTTVRVICRAAGCGAVAEVPIDRLILKGPVVCPFCNADFDPTHSGKSALAEFARWTRELQRLSKVFEIEFVLPEK